MSVVIKGDSNVNLDFTTGGRITGDFSNATIASRVAFQTTTVNGATRIPVIPNGTSNVSAIAVLNNSDANNASWLQLATTATEVVINSTLSGTGTYLPMTFYTGGSERVRIDTAGNVGIGTSTVGARLTTQAAANSYVAGALQINSLSATYKSYITNVGGLLLFSNSTTVDQLVLDASGNLGLGVTPSAWGGGYTGLQVRNSFSIWAATGTSAYLSRNVFYDGTSRKYVFTGAAAEYELGAGTHSWYTAPSGTAGNAISFTQALTLEASGNLLLGTTSNTQSARLNVQGGYIFLKESGGGDIYFRSGYNGTDPAIQVVSSSPLLFLTANTERARINASGQLLVGTTSSLGTAGQGQFVQTGAGSAGAGISVNASSDTFAYSVAWLAANRSASTAFNFINCTSDLYTSPQFRVQGNGVILATNTTVQSISDARTKENIRDSEDGLQVILGLQPRRFDFKQGFGNGRKNALGFIAQEIEAVFPDAVSEVYLDPDNNDVAYKTVGPGELIPVLVKAIQELKAMNDTLTARVAQLEAK